MTTGILYFSVRGDDFTPAQSLADMLTAVDANTTDEANLLAMVAGALAAGALRAHVRAVADQSATGTQATATITLVYASLAANDTLDIGSVRLTCKTGAPANESEFRKQTDLATTVTNLVTCINAHTKLQGLITAVGVTATGVVTLTFTFPGRLANLVGLASSNGTGAAVSGAGLSGASGAYLQAARSYAFGQAT